MQPTVAACSLVIRQALFIVLRRSQHYAVQPVVRGVREAFAERVARMDGPLICNVVRTFW